MTEGNQPDPTPAPEGAGVEVPDDISGIDNLLEEGGPLEPQDVAAVEGTEVSTGSTTDGLAAAQSKVSELTLDLQRLQAEYLNYKRRVDRDRELIKENATYAALAPIVEVLDTIDRAREHEPLEGGFKAVAEQLERVVAGVGLVKFGEPGEPFDPTLHEALSHLGADADVQVTTVKLVAKAGYKIGDRVVRAAQVLVVDPE
ncbi:MAG TPA: nucleotide exchange factor GrpE [Nocardioides sp.]|nr:nucleotide exchange factor GrpE [Nocardioides sp.]